MTDALRPLVVCADDFGIESGVDLAIVELANAGRLSATGCLVTSQRFPSAAYHLAQLPIDIGLHLNFTEFLGLPGFYTPLSRLIAMTYTHQISREKVRQHIHSQLDLFEQYVKRQPDFVDGHLHVHQFPVIREELLIALKQRYLKRLPWIRNTKPTRMNSTLAPMQRVKAHVIGALGSAKLVRLAGLSGSVVNDGLMGAYDFSRPHPPYLQMLGDWLKHARVNSLLMTHPAKHASDKLAFGIERMEEYRILKGVAFTALLKNNHLVVSRLTSSMSADDGMISSRP